MPKKNTAPTKAGYHTFADGVRYVLQQLGGTSFATVFRTMLIILNIIVIIFLYNVVTSQSTVEKIIDTVIESDQEEEDNMTIRDQVGPQIMHNLNKLLYSLNADRAFIIELHNGKMNASKMPFKFFDMTYEEVNEELTGTYISDNFMQVMVSHYKLPFWMADNHTFIGNVDDLAEIDGRFATNFEKHGGKYLCLILLHNKRSNLGFLGIAYNDLNHVKDPEEIKKKLYEYEKVISPLLDLTTQKEKFKLVPHHTDD